MMLFMRLFLLVPSQLISAKQVPFLGMSLPVELVSELNKPPFPRVNVVMEESSARGADAVRHDRLVAEEKKSEADRAFFVYKQSVQRAMVEEESRFEEVKRIRNRGTGQQSV